MLPPRQYRLRRLCGPDGYHCRPSHWAASAVPTPVRGMRSVPTRGSGDQRAACLLTRNRTLGADSVGTRAGRRGPPAIWTPFLCRRLSLAQAVQRGTCAGDGPVRCWVLRRSPSSHRAAPARWGWGGMVGARLALAEAGAQGAAWEATRHRLGSGALGLAAYPPWIRVMARTWIAMAMGLGLGARSARGAAGPIAWTRAEGLAGRTRHAGIPPESFARA